MDKVLRIIEALKLDVSIDGSNFVRFQPNGTVADSCVNCPADTIASNDRRRDLLIELISRLSPISTAFAGGGSSDDGSSDDDGDGGMANVITFRVCSTVRGATNGRSIGISATGQVKVTRTTCG